MTKRTPEMIERIREMAAAGAFAKDIARTLGIAAGTVARWATRADIPLMTMSEASRKALADPEVRARMSEASRKAWADPEVRARMSEARRKALADPEVRARMSEASRRAWADRKSRGVQVPHWVPGDLIEEYIDLAILHGEEYAAAAVRRMKREAAA